MYNLASDIRKGRSNRRESSKSQYLKTTYGVVFWNCEHKDFTIISSGVNILPSTYTSNVCCQFYEKN
jgi:hypothetical protein